MAGDEIYPPYTPMSSLGHELGILFGFLGAGIVIMIAYTVIWQLAQRKTASKDLARRKELHAKGYHRDRGGIHEKMLGRYASPIHRAELPVEEADAIGVAITGSGAKALGIGFERTMNPLSNTASVTSSTVTAGVKKGSGVMREIL